MREIFRIYVIRYVIMTMNEGAGGIILIITLVITDTDSN